MVQVPADKKVWIEYRILRIHRPSKENWSLFANIQVPGYTWMFDTESFLDENDAVERVNEIADRYGVPHDARQRKPALKIHCWW